ncbi:hypothetical protein RYX36_002214, partial [Vicia faba]
YIAPQQVPVQYGGLSREGEQEFTTADPATEVIIKPATKHAVEFPISEVRIKTCFITKTNLIMVLVLVLNCGYVYAVTLYTAITVVNCNLKP